MKACEIFFALPARLLFTARANLIRHPFVACATVVGNEAGYERLLQMCFDGGVAW